MNREQRLLKLSQMKDNLNPKIDMQDYQGKRRKVAPEKHTSRYFDYAKYFSTAEYLHLFPNDSIDILYRKFPYILSDDFLDFNSDIIARADLVKFIGRGQFGVAMLTSRGTIFKIFKTQKDYNQYKKIYDEQFLGKSNTLDPKIYSIGIFDTSNVKMDMYVNPFIAYVEMEKLKGVDDSVKNRGSHIVLDQEQMPIGYKHKRFRILSVEKLVEGVIAHVINKVHFKHQKIIYSPELSNEAKKEFFNSKENVKNFINDCYNDLVKGNEYVNDYVLNLVTEVLGLPNHDWYIKLIESAVFKTLKDETDLHIGNIGFRDSNPVFFDS
jgi:hypothetical protein